MARKMSAKKRKKLKYTSVLPLCITAGFFLGIGLGMAMASVLLVTLLGMAAGAGIGYYIDRRNGLSYTARNRRKR